MTAFQWEKDEMSKNGNKAKDNLCSAMSSPAVWWLTAVTCLGIAGVLSVFQPTPDVTEGSRLAVEQFF
jgi:hypothetical protein